MGLTTRELEQLSGREYVTLRAWSRRGWLRPPELKHFGRDGGRGSRLLWPQGSSEKVQEILRLQRMGLTVTEIEKLMKGKTDV